MSALWGLLRKEVYHIRRDRRTLVVLVLLPVLQVIIFGYAIRTDVKNIRIVIVDQEPDYATLALRSRLAATDAFKVLALVDVAPKQMLIEARVIDASPDFTKNLGVEWSWNAFNFVERPGLDFEGAPVRAHQQRG